MIVLILNLIVVIFFLCFLTYTLIAKRHLESLARGCVTEKTLAYSASVVQLAELSLDLPIVQENLSNEHEGAIRDEIAAYRKDPGTYISDLTRQQQPVVVQVVKMNPLLEKVALIKESIRLFYDDTLASLISDLRIFSLSNLFAGAVAFLLAFRSTSGVQKPVIWFSYIMFVAVLYCSYMYLDQLTFFRILFQMHMGWWYAATLLVMIAGLYLEHGRSRR